jgi:hypothetical protein
MRTLSTALRKVYEAEGGYAVHSRARLSNDGGSTWTDLRSLKDRDFYLGASWTESVDQAITELHLFLRREVDGWSLSPNMESNPLNLAAGSYEPLLQKAFTRVQVQVAITPSGLASPADGNFLTVFQGLLVSFSAAGGGGALDCYCRDLGDLLMHTNFIEEEVEYGSDLGTSLEDVIQDILDGNGFSGVSLYTPTSPGWDLGRYKQKCEPVFTACETLAMQLGWRVSYAFDASDNYRFTLWAPDRDSTSPVYTLKDYQRLDVPSFGAETDYIRNAVEIAYFDKADLDASGQPKLKRVLVDKDYTGDAGVAAMAAASETAHGRRFMRYAPAAGANIDTQAEAERLGEAALKDLAEPMVDFEVETPFLHFLQLGDLITVPADNVNHDVDLDAAVTVLRHALTEDGRASTTLGLRGTRPQGARVQWMQRMAHPAVTRPLTLTGPDAVSNVTVEETTEGTLVWFDEPLRNVRPFDYELHVYTSSGATLSDSTLYATSRTNNFTVTSLAPGTTYYAKVVPRSAPLEANRAGNRGTASSEVTINPRYVEPRRLQPRVTYASLPLNSDFEAANAGSGVPPDGWEMLDGAWNTDFSLSTDSNSGSNAVVLGPTATDDPEIGSQLFVVYPSTRYAFRARFKSNKTTGPPALVEYPQVVLRWYSDVSTVISSSGSGPTSTTANTWGTVEGVATAPSTAKFARVVLTSTDNSATQTIVYDSVSVEIASIPLEDLTYASHQNSFSDVADANVGPAAYYRNANGETCLQGAVRRVAGAPAAGTVMFSLPAALAPQRKRRFAVPTDTGLGVVQAEINGDVTYQSGGVTEFFLDGIRFRVDAP